MNNIIEKNQDRIIFITKIIFVIFSLLMALPILNHWLYDINKILSIWSLVILAFLFFTKKINFKNKEIIILGVLCCFYFITILKNGRNHFLNEIMILLYMIELCFVCTYCDEKKNKEEVMSEILKIFWLFIIITFIFTCVNLIIYIYDIAGYLKVKEYVYFFPNYGGKLGGIYNPNTGAVLNYISMIFSFIIYKKLRKGKVFLLLNIMIQGISLILYQSRGAWMSFIFYVVTVFFLIVIQKRQKISKRTKVVAGIISLICVGFCVYSLGKRYGIFQDEAVFSLTADWNTISSGRIQLWEVAFQGYKDNPILGIGYRNIDDVLKAGLPESIYSSVIAGGLHNIYITILVSSGIVGFLSLLIFFILILKKVIRLLFDPEVPEEIKLFSMFIPTWLLGELVESRIIFGMNWLAVLFWITAGYVIYFSWDKGNSLECE